ncbi:hypothetical protein D3C78_786320 [compost metagenome]
MVAHLEAHAIAGGFQAQFHGRVRRRVAQGVVEQIAQRGNRQHRGHLHRCLGITGRQVQLDPATVATRRVLNRQTGDLFGAALHTIVERQAALDPGQQQQLLQGPVQAIGALLGTGQGLVTGSPFSHAGHLQVSLDGRQRAAQLMGCVAGQPTLALDGLANALEQLVLGL